MRNCLDGEETARQNSWELLGSGWEEGMSCFFVCFFFPDVSLEKTRTESCDGSTKKSGSHVLGGRRQGGGHLRPFVTGSPAPSGYGEDGVYSREAADIK